MQQIGMSVCRGLTLDTVPQKTTYLAADSTYSALPRLSIPITKVSIFTRETFTNYRAIGVPSEHGLWLYSRNSRAGNNAESADGNP